MIYRFRSKLATQDRIKGFVVGVKGSKKMPYVPTPKEYESLFARCNTFKSKSGFEQFKAPDFNTKKWALNVQIDPGSEMPDIWGIGSHLICSEVFKAVMDTIDCFDHQFIQVELVDFKGDTIPQEKKYYWLNIKRFLKFELGKKEYNDMDFGFFPTIEEKAFLPGLLECASIYKDASKLPVWRLFGADPQLAGKVCSLQTFYFNESFLKECQKAGVAGMALYTRPYGCGEESVCVVPSKAGQQA